MNSLSIFNITEINDIITDYKLDLEVKDKTRKTMKNIFKVINNQQHKIIGDTTLGMKSIRYYFINKKKIMITYHSGLYSLTSNRFLLVSKYNEFKRNTQTTTINDIHNQFGHKKITHRRWNKFF